jgi:Leucine-rich repeat (LRR) protein
MKLAASGLLNGALVGLVVAALGVACGSDAERRKDLDAEAGAGGLGGAAGETMKGEAGIASPPQALGGAAGEPSGQGGAPMSAAGAPIVEGGAPPASGGVDAGGEGGVPSLPPVDCSTIAFEDPGLLSAVLLELDKQPGDEITTAEAAAITELYAGGFNIAQLDGIECLTSLASANFGIGGATNDITNLEPLRYLKALTELDLSHNPLTDLSALAEVPSLETLDLSYAIDGNDLTPLAQAPSLVELRLYGSVVGDLTPLGQSATLRRLDVNNATLNQPATLASLTKLTELNVSNLGDATPLGALTNLTSLTVRDAMSNINALSSLVNLTYLDAYAIGMNSAAPLANMTKLEELTIDNNGITDIAPLANLTKLSRLSLTGNPFTSLTPLVANSGMGTGDVVYMFASGVTCVNDKANITTLVNRGVTLNGAPSCP